MSSIDERVVKMEFNNQEFEKNAEETMSTLDKLKEALKFDNVKDSFKKLTEASNKVDMSGIERSTDVISMKFSAMQIAGYTAIANLTNRLMNFAHSVVSGMFSKIVQGGINRAFNIEKAKFSIEGLGMSFKKLDSDISYAVKGTAYGYDEAAMAASSMAASGIKAGNEMKVALRSISGMAAMTGSSYSEIANIFTTVAGNSRVLTQQLNQLSARGVNAATTLRDYINKHEDLRKHLIEEGLKKNKKAVEEFADATKLTEKNIRSLVSTGVVDFHTFSNAIDEAFGEHAKAADKTFRGVLTNIKAAWSRIGQQFAQPLIANNQIDNMLNVIETPIRNSANKTKELRKNTKEARKDIFEALKESGNFSTKLIETLKKTKEFSKKSTDEIREIYAKDPEKFLKSVQKVKGYADTTKKELKNLMTTTNSDLRFLYKEHPKKFLKQVQEIQRYSQLTGKDLGHLMRSTRDEFIHTIKTTQTFVDKLRKTKEFAGKSKKEIFELYKADPKKFLESVQKIDKYSGLTGKKLKEMMKVSKEYARYSNKSDKYLGKIYDKYYKVQYNLVGVLQAVKRIFVAIEERIKGSKALKDFLKITEKGCKTLIFLFNGVAATIGGVTKRGKKYLEVFGDRKHLIPITKIWKELRKMLGLAGKEHRQDWENLKNTFKGIYALFDAFKFVIHEVIDVFKPTKRETKDFVSLLLEFTSAVSDLIQKFANWIKTSGKVRTFLVRIRGIVVKILSPIQKTAKFIINIIKWFTKGQKPALKLADSFGKLFDAIHHIKEVITDKVVGAFEKFINLFVGEGKIAKTSSDLFDKAMGVICNAISFLSDSLATGINWIADFIDKFSLFDKIIGIGEAFAGVVVGVIIPAIKDLYGWMKKFIDNGINSFMNLFNPQSMNISKSAKGMTEQFNPFTQFFESLDPTTIASNIKEKILTVLDAIVNFDYGAALDKIKEKWDSFVDYLDEVKVKVGEAFDKLKATLQEHNINFESIGEKLQVGFDNAFTVVVNNAPKAVETIRQFIVGIFKTIKKVLPDPQDIAVPLAEFVVSVIKSIVSFLPWFIETVTTTLQIIANDLADSFMEITDALVDILSSGLTKSMVIGSGKNKRIVKPISESITQTIKNAIQQIDWTAILKAFETLAKIKMAVNAGGFFKSGSKLFDQISLSIKQLTGVVDKKFSDDRKIEKLMALAQVLKNLAIAIGVIAAAVVVFAYIPAKKLEQGAKYMAGIAVGLIAFMVVITGLYEISELTTDNNSKLDKVVEGVANLAKGIAALIGAFVLLSVIPFKEGRLEESLAIIFVLLTEIGLFVFAISKIEPNSEELESTGIAIETISKGIFKLVEAIAILSLIDPEKSWNAVLEIAALLFALAGAIKVLDKATKGFNMKSLISVLPIVIMLAAIIGALAAIKYLDLDTKQLLPIIGTLVILTAIVAALGGIAKMMKGVDVMGVLGLVLIMAGMLFIVIGALWVIKALELDPQGLLWISVSLLIMAGVIAVLGVIGTVNPAAGAAAALQLVEFIGILLILLLALGALSTSDKVKSLIQNGGDMLKLIGEMLAQVVVGFIEGCKTAIQSLMGMDVDESQVDKIEKVAKLLGHLAKVQAILQKGGGKILSFFAGDKPFTKFGNGIKNLFESFKDVGTAAGEITNVDKIKEVTKVAKTLSEIVDVIKDPKALGDVLAISGQGKLAKLGEDLIAFATSAQTAISSFGDADTSSMKDAAKDIASSVKKISKALPKDGLQNTGSDAVDSIKSGIKGGGTKIAKQLGSELTSAINSISTDRFSTKGEYFIKAFIKGMNKQKKNLKEDAKKAAKAASGAMDDQDVKNGATTAGENVIKGFKNGLNKDYLKSEIARICKAIGKSAIDNLNKGAGNASPSRFARQSGINVDQGFINGMSKMVGNVSATAKNVGDTAIKSLKSAMMNANNFVMTGVSDPVIKPVLDLSNVKMGMNSLGSMLNNNYAIGVAGGMDKVNAGSRSVSIVNNITVDGAEDPMAWVDAFSNELEVQARM